MLDITMPNSVGTALDEVVGKLLKLKKWDKLNETQQISIDQGLLGTNSNFVLIAPTSSGKTGVAQLAMLQALEKRQRIIYLVPMKPLINEKTKDFKDLFDNIAGIDSSPTEWDKADIVITTFETFYKTALTQTSHAQGFGLAIVDEFHLLYDPMRGFNLEKVITIIKELGIRIICLSATFEDNKEIGAWLNAKVVVIPETTRKVQLKHGIIDMSGVAMSRQNKELCVQLLQMRKEPYLVFCTTKESTSARAREMCTLLNKAVFNEGEIRTEVTKTLARKRLTNGEEELLKCLTKGVGFHHSGLDQRLRNLVETMFANKGINYLFATTGLAYGVNFPAKTVVVADTSFYDSSMPGRRMAIPVYMYVQMAGRAGRPGFGDEGYAFVVKKRGESDVAKYQNNTIERAISVIGRDDYFRKAILELIYSDRCKDEQILSFFQNTFFSFQSERQKVQFVPFSLFEILKGHVRYLYDNGFVTHVGAAGYKLTGLGEVTIGFLFSTFANYALEPFLEINKMLSADGSVRMDHSIIYRMSQLFNGACLGKIHRERSEKVTSYYERIGVPASDLGNPEYSAYAVCNGWMENLELADIESDCKVSASQCPQVAIELYKLLGVYEKLALKRGIAIPPEFKDFRDRVRFGVTEEELPLARLRGIGRATTRKIKAYCENALRKPPWSLKGSILEIFLQIYRKEGETRFIETLQFVKGVGKGKKLDKILGLIRSKANV